MGKLPPPPETKSRLAVRMSMLKIKERSCSSSQAELMVTMSMRVDVIVSHLNCNTSYWRDEGMGHGHLLSRLSIAEAPAGSSFGPN